MPTVYNNLRRWLFIPPLLALFLFELLQQPVFAAPDLKENTSETRILKWKGGKEAVFMLEFDDSAPSHILYVIPELKKRNIPGTFYINPGNGSYKTHQEAWLREAQTPGIELANHTWSHFGARSVEDFDNELSKTNETIYSAYPDRKRPRLISFGRPGVPKQNWRITDEELKDALTKHHLVARPPFHGLPWHENTIPAMTALIDRTLSRGTMGHLDFHGVGGDWLSISKEYFIATLDKLEAHRDQLWLTDPISWHKYDIQRNASTLREVSSSSKEVLLELVCTTDPAFYDYPLTLAVKVPSNWTRCEIIQGDKRISASAAKGEARFDVLPVSGQIIIRAGL
jgi:peptidoglycan/xylan/chitin deacetylase (PgdA/CDA1 family)